MTTRAETGLLVIADLTGYSAYLGRAELEHAPVIAGDLLDTIIGRLEPPFRLSKLEGDAAFLFAEDGRAGPALFVDAIVAAYSAFRRRLRSIEAATTCGCDACGLAPELDLKVVLHHGAFVRSRIAGRDELAGPAVIVAHRLLKGTAVRIEGHGPTGPRGIAAITTAALDALAPALDRELLPRHAESIEHLGDIETHVLDLEALWQAEGTVRRVDIDPTRAVLALETRLGAGIAEAWDLVTAPDLRSRWQGTIETVDGPGDADLSRCVTGRLAALEEVVDWQPYQHVGRRVTIPGLGTLDASVDLEADGTSTRVRFGWLLADETTVDEATKAVFIDEQRAAVRRLGRLRPGDRVSLAGSPEGSIEGAP
jgi:hypothetical protein